MHIMCKLYGKYSPIDFPRAAAPGVPASTTDPRRKPSCSAPGSIGSMAPPADRGMAAGNGGVDWPRWYPSSFPKLGNKSQIIIVYGGYINGK